MRTNEITFGSGGASGASGATARRVASTALASFARGFRAWHRAHVINQTAGALRTLDDGTLRDIGVDRSGIYAAAVRAWDESERADPTLAA